MLRLAILSIVCSFSLLACDDPPEKVTVEICVAMVSDGECVCGVKKPNTPTVNFRHESLSYCDRATAFPPEAWEKYHTYVDQLEDWVSRAKAKAKAAK
jgi:hypothetical protein